MMEERAENHDQAIAQYRAILTYSPNDPLALNNLAYALAVYRNSPEEALPFAERATVAAREDPAAIGGASLLNYYSLGTYRREPLVPYSLDTLAWVQHLLGRDVEAANTIREARAAVGGYAPDLRWHAAVIYAAIDDVAKAAEELGVSRQGLTKLMTRLGIGSDESPLATKNE